MYEIQFKKVVKHKLNHNYKYLQKFIVSNLLQVWRNYTIIVEEQHNDRVAPKQTPIHCMR
jgi:hypothetical protein